MITPRNPLGRSSSPDDDPTGVRALLSSLPDPGPMPPELVERITASLAEEERTRTERRGEPGADGERTAYGSSGGASVSPFVRRKRRRQILSGIAGAAAAVVVGWVGVSALNQPGGGSSGSLAGAAASAPSPQGGEHADSGGSASGGSGSSPRVQGLPAGQLAAVRVEHSGRDYRAATFTAQAAALAAAATKPQPKAHVGPRAGGATPRIATPGGLSDCLAGLGVQSTGVHPAVADLARYAGKPAVVLVVTSRATSGATPGATPGATSAGPTRAWAVGRDCSASDPHVLHGPVTLR